MGLKDKTVADLREMAKDREIAGYRAMKKADLVAALAEEIQEARVESGIVDYLVLRSFVGHYEWQGRKVDISAGMNDVIQVPKNEGWERAGFVELAKPGGKAGGREAAMRPRPETR